MREQELRAAVRSRAEMNLWSRLLFGSDQRIGERNILWNMLGSAVYALTSMLLGAAVTRCLGADAGGIFFFAFSTFGQQMFIVAYFGMRPLQITDATGRFSFAEYRHFRCLSCLAAAVLSLCYALTCTEAGTARSVLLLMAIYKVLDGYADCYDSEFQRQGRLYLAGKSNAFRTLLSVLLFTGVMLKTGDLVLSSAAAVLGQGFSLLLFCVLPLREFRAVSFRRQRGSVWALFQRSRWLFVSSFLDLYIFAASKYAVNRHMSSADNGYYTTIFIPTSVINLMANFVIRPVLTGLSEKRERGDRAGFLGLLQKIALLIAIFTLLGAGAAWLLGIPVLSLLVGAEAGAALRPYRGALIEVIFGGGFYALLNLLYYVLVILEAQRSIFLIYGGTTVFAWLISDVMVLRRGIPGAAEAYLLTMLLLTLCFLFSAAQRLRRDERLNVEERA